MSLKTPRPRQWFFHLITERLIEPLFQDFELRGVSIEASDGLSGGGKA